MQFISLEKFVQSTNLLGVPSVDRSNARKNFGKFCQLQKKCLNGQIWPLDSYQPRMQIRSLQASFPLETKLSTKVRSKRWVPRIWPQSEIAAPGTCCRDLLEDVLRFRNSFWRSDYNWKAFSPGNQTRIGQTMWIRNAEEYDIFHGFFYGLRTIPVGVSGHVGVQ